jgi:hypothetical protein
MRLCVLGIMQEVAETEKETEYETETETETERLLYVIFLYTL